MPQFGPWILRVLKPRRIFLDDGRLPLDDLAFLRRHSQTVRSLRIQGEGMVDVGAVHALGALEALQIKADTLSAPLELAHFPRLKDLVLDGDFDIEWAGVGQLERVELVGADERAAEAISLLSRLEEARLIDGRLPCSFSGPLVRLEVEHPTHMPAAPITGLDGVSELVLTAFPAASLALFKGVTELDVLHVLDSPELLTLAGVQLSDAPDADLWLANCPNLADLAEVAVPGEASIDDCPNVP